jgi:hypothetical protein
MEMEEEVKRERSERKSQKQRHFVVLEDFVAFDYSLHDA